MRAGLIKLIAGLSMLAALAAWQKKKLQRAKAESKPRELVHTRRCGPTELFPVLRQIRERIAKMRWCGPNLQKLRKDEQ
jgi:hypothetical protein